MALRMSVTTPAAEHLLSVRPAIERCLDFTAPEGPTERIGNGWVHDSELGFTLVNSVRENSVDSSRGVYTYDAPLAGAVDRPRAVLNNGGGSPCRIHTYGDSFTHCDQVSE